MQYVGRRIFHVSGRYCEEINQSICRYCRNCRYTTMCTQKRCWRTDPDLYPDTGGQIYCWLNTLSILKYRCRSLDRIRIPAGWFKATHTFRIPAGRFTATHAFRIPAGKFTDVHTYTDVDQNPAGRFTTVHNIYKSTMLHRYVSEYVHAGRFHSCSYRYRSISVSGYRRADSEQHIHMQI